MAGLDPATPNRTGRPRTADDRYVESDWGGRVKLAYDEKAGRQPYRPKSESLSNEPNPYCPSLCKIAGTCTWSPL
jgi:hypothetical protein